MLCAARASRSPTMPLWRVLARLGAALDAGLERPPWGALAPLGVVVAAMSHDDIGQQATSIGVELAAAAILSENVQ